MGARICIFLRLDDSIFPVSRPRHSEKRISPAADQCQSCEDEPERNDPAGLPRTAIWKDSAGPEVIHLKGEIPFVLDDQAKIDIIVGIFLAQPDANAAFLFGDLGPPLAISLQAVKRGEIDRVDPGAGGLMQSGRSDLAAENIGMTAENEPGFIRTL